ncbi:MAG: hypothetical protein HC819_21915 [Cyclobacteriaceae bacterium]|nr:hypothetical protein [Cyclobacteriaceae bacterium]
MQTITAMWTIKPSYLAIGIMMSLIIAFTSCMNQQPGESNNEVEQAEETESIDYGQKMLRESMQEDIDLADEYIQKMENKLDIATAGEKEDITAAIAEIEAEKQQIQAQLSEVTNATVDTWQTVKNDVEKSVNYSRHKIDSLVKNTEKP